MSSDMSIFSAGTVHVKPIVLVLTASLDFLCVRIIQEMEVWGFWYCLSYTAIHWRCFQLSSQCEYWQTCTHTQILMTYFLVCKIIPLSDLGYVILFLFWHCTVHITVYIVAWFNMQLYYRDCFLKPFLLGRLHMKPIWDNREPTGKYRAFTPSALVSLAHHRPSVYRCIYSALKKCLYPLNVSTFCHITTKINVFYVIDQHKVVCNLEVNVKWYMAFTIFYKWISEKCVVHLFSILYVTLLHNFIPGISGVFLGLHDAVCSRMFSNKQNSCINTQIKLLTGVLTN